MLWIGLDDTDTLDTRGTGHLARLLAAELSDAYTIHGVTRHQLLLDPRIPYTKKNSSAALHLAAQDTRPAALDALFERVGGWLRAACPPGSDPGLCVALDPPESLTVFGARAKREVLAQAQARTLAADAGVRLAGLGGSEDGVIGALAAVGLAAGGTDGRYVLVGASRELAGLQPVGAVLAAGIARVETEAGEALSQGMVWCDKLRPALRGGLPVVVVAPADGHWLPLRFD